MEEVVTIDGRQFKLTVDRPLTATEKAQVLADIRKQTGCSTCGGNRTLGMGGDYGIFGMNTGSGSCTAPAKSMGQTVTLSAAPTGGTEPYTVNFWIKFDNNAPVQTVTSGNFSGTAYSGVGEGVAVTGHYILTESDMPPSLAGSATATWATGVNTSSGAPLFGATANALSAGYFRVYSTVFDTCPTGSQTCVNECDVAITCVAPTCNFVVT